MLVTTSLLGYYSYFILDQSGIIKIWLNNQNKWNSKQFIYKN